MTDYIYIQSAPRKIQKENLGEILIKIGAIYAMKILCKISHVKNVRNSDIFSKL